MKKLIVVLVVLFSVGAVHAQTSQSEREVQIKLQWAKDALDARDYKGACAIFFYMMMDPYVQNNRELQQKISNFGVQACKAAGIKFP